MGAMSGRIVALLASALLLGACSSLGGLASLLPTHGPGGATDAPLSTPAGQLTPPPTVIACDIIPVSDVDSLSPFGTAMVNFEDSGGCHYYPDVETEQRPASVDVVVESFYSPTEASEGLAFLRQDLIDRETEVTIADAAGVGDDAFSWVDRIGDEAALWSISDQFLIKVTMRGEFQDNMGPDVSAPAKLDSAEAMTNLIISRLPR